MFGGLDWLTVSSVLSRGKSYYAHFVVWNV
jgi:hypothetical protein